MERVVNTYVFIRAFEERCHSQKIIQIYARQLSLLILHNVYRLFHQAHASEQENYGRWIGSSKWRAEGEMEENGLRLGSS